VANGGKRYKPILLEAVKTFDGRLLHTEAPEVVGKLPVDEAVLELVQTGLWQAVNGEHGTAQRIRMKDIAISGKTGTSQVISRKNDDDQLPEDQMPAHLRAHAWFVAAAPSDAPRIAVAVVVEHGEHGSGAAAPIAKEVIKTYLRGNKSGSRLLARKLNKISF
jgi:penicillin-binding protein 2